MANLVKSRDGMYGCLAPVKDKLDVTDVALIEPAWIIPPKLFDDEEMVPQVGSLLLIFRNPKYFSC